jgi:hypothetical protein
MAKNDFVNLGREYSLNEPCCASPRDAKSAKKAEKRISYPTIYISGVTGLDLPTGEITFTAKGRVVSITDRKADGKGSDFSCEIEVHSIKAESGEGAEGGLEEAIEKIAKKKASK